MRDLVGAEDVAHGRVDVPMRFEIEVELGGGIYQYAIAFERPKDYELRVFEEKLLVGTMPVYSREGSQVYVGRGEGQSEPRFGIDSQLVALPIIQGLSPKDPLYIFKRWLARLVILHPIPSLIIGESRQQTLEPRVDVVDYGGWFSALTGYYPAAYGRIDQFLKQVMPDLVDIQIAEFDSTPKSLAVQFSTEQGSIKVPFANLSDGEKCFMICALVLAANDSYGPIVCFWDEPDSHLALSEVGHFVLALRKAFKSGGLFIATSHNPEAIRGFSEENTLVLYRNSHLEPTIVRPVSELRISGDLVSALIRGDVEP